MQVAPKLNADLTEGNSGPLIRALGVIAKAPPLRA
jgi:hypothetical protein